MSLLNAALAFGALAFTIPLVIHLFFRSRFKTLDWGAMYLLESVVRVNRRRMQLTNLLLLLLRCAIPVLLAFCLARPVWTGLRALAGDAPKTLVLAIDDSRSMSVIPPGGESRIERAKKEIRAVLDDLTRRDEVILVRSSRLGAVPSKMGVSEALAQLRKIDATGNAVSVGQLIDAAHVAAEEGTHPRKQILLVSDFQASAVDAASIELARRLQQTAAIEQQANAADPLVIDFLDVGNGWDELSNVSVDDVTIDSPVVVSERAGVYTATLRNASELPANDLRLVWAIDGKPLEPRVVSIDAKSTATNRLTHTISESGMHEVSVSVDRGDVLVDDNRRSVAVEVIQEVNVLLVDGKPSREPLGGQADFLAIALSPFAFGGDDRPDPVRATVVPTRQIETALTENDVRVILLCGVGQLPDSTIRQITEFVLGGGSLVVFDGPAGSDAAGSDAAGFRRLYAQPWTSGEQTLRFPASPGEIVGDPEIALKDATESFAIDQPTPLYGPWSVFTRGGENPLAGVKLTAYRSLELSDAPQTSTDPDAPAPAGSDSENAIAADPTLPDRPGLDVPGTGDRFVLLRTAEGAPLAVMGDAGEGTIVQFAIPGNDAWTDLPLRPVFLPLIQQMVLDLAGKREGAMIGVGQPIVIDPSDWPPIEIEPQTPTRVVYSARTPRGDMALDSPVEGEPLRMTATYVPGTYTVEKRIREIANPENTRVVETMRIATVDASESMLVDVTEERLESLAGTLDAQVFETAAVLRDADRSRSFGREIWRWLLALLLLALVAELWLQQNLIKRRLAGGGTT